MRKSSTHLGKVAGLVEGMLTSGFRFDLFPQSPRSSLQVSRPLERQPCNVPMRWQTATARLSHRLDMARQPGRATLDICLWPASDPCFMVCLDPDGPRVDRGYATRHHRGFLDRVGRGVFESGSGGPSRVNRALWWMAFTEGSYSSTRITRAMKELEILGGVSFHPFRLILLQ